MVELVGARSPTLRRGRQAFAGLAAFALAAAVVVAVVRDGGPDAGALLQAPTPSLEQMLAESRRLQEEGKSFPTFDVPSSTADRVRDMGQHASSGKHALDWRGDDQGAQQGDSPKLKYVPPPGPIDRVDDPVGGKDGWVEVGDRAFRVTRNEDGSLDHLDVPGDATVRPVADGWEVDIPDAGERDRYNERYMMRRAFNRLRRSHFSDEQWAANRLTRKFYRADVDKSSRRDPEWLETPSEMNRAGWNEDNSKMFVHAGRDAGEEWSDDAGTRDRYYHWVTADGRTDTDAIAGDGGKSVESRVQLDNSAARQHPVPRRDAKQTIHIADAEDPSNQEKVESVTREWSKVSAPGDLPGEDAEVSSSESSARDDAGDNAEIAGQAIDRAAYGIPERAPARSSRTARGGEAPPRTARDGLAAPRQVWGGWEPKLKPITDVYAPNEDPFYCMDGSESSICGTTGRREQRHDFSLGWGGAAKAQRALAHEKSLDRSEGAHDAAGRTGHVEMSGGEQRRDREAMERDAQIEHSMESMRSVDDGVPFDKRVSERTREEGHERGFGEGERTGHRGVMDKSDPYRYIRSGSYSRILANEDRVEQRSQGSSGPSLRSTSVAQPNTWVSSDDMPYKVKAPYDGSLIRIGYPNMRGGMRSEDGELLPYDDRSGKGNNEISHKDWASDVWARPSPWGVRDVRDSLNRNEEGGARRLVDEKGFHEYEAGNRGFHEQRPDDPHDHWDSDESSRLRVDQFDVVGDEEGRRRAARGGDGNPDEYDSTRPAAKADYDVDMGVQTRDRSKDGEVQHVYMPYPENPEKAAWGEADSAARLKERAAARLAWKARHRQSLVKPREGSDERGKADEESRDDERARWARRWESEERSVGFSGQDAGHKEERRDGEGEPRILQEQRRFAREHREEEREREMARAQQWQRRGARDGSDEASHRARHAGRAWSAGRAAASTKAKEERVDAIAAARLAAQSAQGAVQQSLASAGAEQRVNELAQGKQAAVARLTRRHAAAATAGAGGVSKIAAHMRSWLGVYERQAPKPQHASLSDGVDAVDHYNRKALAHILSSAHGGDAAARLTARQAYATLKASEHPLQAALKRRCVPTCRRTSQGSGGLWDFVLP